MNFFKDRELAHRLRTHQVSSKEKFFYFLAFFLIIHISLFIKVYAQKTNYILDFVMVIVEIIGLTICYQTNCKGNNKEFIERYISLFLPIFIRMLSMIIIVSFAMIISFELIYLFNYDNIDNFLTSDKYQMLEFIVSVAFIIYFYMRMRKAIAIAASGSEHLPLMS